MVMLLKFSAPANRKLLEQVPKAFDGVLRH